MGWQFIIHKILALSLLYSWEIHSKIIRMDVEAVNSSYFIDVKRISFYDIHSVPTVWLL
jgi:hypothetical protein